VAHGGGRDARIADGIVGLDSIAGSGGKPGRCYASVAAPERRCWRRQDKGHRVPLRTAKNVAELVFGVLENSFLLLRQIFSGAIDIEIQHRHRRLIRDALAASASLSGPFQRDCDLVGILRFTRCWEALAAVGKNSWTRLGKSGSSDGRGAWRKISSRSNTRSNSRSACAARRRNEIRLRSGRRRDWCASEHKAC